MSIAIGIEPLRYVVEEKTTCEGVETRQPIAAFFHLNDAIDYLKQLVPKYGASYVQNNLWHDYPVCFLNDSVFAIRKNPTIVKNKDVYNWVK